MVYTAAVTQAPHASFRNGGESANARQYFARPTQHTPNGPRIAAAIAGMAPGEFRTVWANSDNEIFRVRYPEDNVSYNILDWTPHGVWDEPTQQVLLGGRRGLTKVIGYADLVGQWRELAMDKVFGRFIAGTVHYYGKIARNPLTGVVYFGTSENDSRLFAFDPTAETWEQLATAPTANNGNGGSFEWAADTERLVQYVGAAERWCIYNPGTNSWTNPYNGIGHGQHAILRYHPTHARHLLVGGTDTNTRASLVTSAGVVTQVTDVPEVIAMSSGSWAHAHPAGCWLVKTMGTTPKVFAAWPNEALDDVTWEDLGEAPDSALSNPTLIPGYSSDTVLIVATTGLYAWALPELTAPGTLAVASLDAAIQAAKTATASLSAALQVQRTATASVTGALQAGKTASASISGAVQQGKSAATSLDAFLFDPGSPLVTASLTAAIQAGRTASASLSAALQTPRSASASVSAALAIQRAAQSSLDSAVLERRGASAALDALLFNPTDPPAPPPAPTLGGGGGADTSRRRRRTREDLERDEEEAFEDVMRHLKRPQREQKDLQEVLEIVMALAAAGVLD